MSGLELTISTNAAEIAERFREVRARVADTGAPNKALAVQLFGDMMRNFDDEGTMFGEPWEPLAMSTLKQKQRLGYSSKPMIRTGFLRNTAWSNATQEFAAVGFLADYASYHDDTDDKYSPSARLPRRRLLPPVAYAYGVGVEVYEWYLTKVSKEAGL